MKMLKKTSTFYFFSNTSRDLRDMLIHHHWYQRRDLGPSVINFFSKRNICFRTSGNVLKGILALSDSQKDASGTHLCPFSMFFIFFLIGIIGRPFRHNRSSWKHNRSSWRHNRSSWGPTCSHGNHVWAQGKQHAFIPIGKLFFIKLAGQL